ncbi:serine/threonine protein kinase [Microcoleus vaginatus PCC 9802]|uniref:bifunctional serine/threonine-protein kinase/formylglycine-generating enzyme family protein n=1 Tax=Microcoleus vaginatus TaxID=119532 RepID=UPI00020D2BAA|nr:serine/threonine protein kinase [Microcoleus vaginatus FGP-2]UNU21916.1 serine/threonine protein kinase [Microcoleus vaginatus PCC 9802]
MVCCINPDCANPQNPDGQTYCISCGVKLVPILRNRYRMIGFLGKGGFGRTYLAEDIDKLNQRCVVKQLAPNFQGTWESSKAVELFQQEARQLQQLGQHPQIPSLDAYFEDNKYLYLVQQFVEGDNLLTLLQDGGIWQESQVKQLLLELLPVLKFIHEQKIIHRDIKPENIMRRRSDGVLMLIDFGVSKQLSGTVMSRLGTQIGTPGYSPFEQMKGGEAYPASDLFSLGATAFHLMTGVHPSDLLLEKGYSWTANWQQHLKTPIDQRLELILSKLLAKDIQQRYQSAEEVLIDFQRQSTPNFIQTLKKFDFDTVTVDVRGNITSHQHRQAQFFRENLGSGATLDMVAIPGGRFVMGSPNTEARRSNNEGPQRTVNISPFFMGKYPITQEQWEVVMGNNPSHIKGLKRPVEQVSWNNALEFCQKISQKTGKIYRLPSEAEWEYACRAGTTTPFYFGETITPDLVNYDGNHPYGSAPKGLYRKQTTDVGSFGPNPFGLYDMHGTVWEWCSDKWHDNYSGAPTDGSSWETGTDNNRVLRGGGWNCNTVYCRSAYRGRHWAGAVHRSRHLGFRVVVASVSSSS